MMRDLYILCGGGSTRMGEVDKALLQLEDETLLERQIRRAASFFRSVTLLSGKHSYDTSVPQLPDAQPDAGPLGGLLSALRDCRHESLAVIPVDLPCLRDETLDVLAARTLPGGVDVYLARSQKRLQPLVGIFSCELADSVEQYLQGKKRSVGDYIEQLSTKTFLVDEIELQNINTPDDFRRLQAITRSKL